jgi:glyoxylase-like metal-dependent hydrolase (beta-lactamase superfamily II)
MEAGSPNYSREGAVQRLLTRLWNGPGHPVVRRLREGDQVGGFTVLETPGVTPGHVSLWRESDRTLIAGEVLNNLHDQVPFATFPPHEPAAFGTADRWRNRASAKRLAALEPALVCFCHGPRHAPVRPTSSVARRLRSASRLGRRPDARERAAPRLSLSAVLEGWKHRRRDIHRGRLDLRKRLRVG